MAISLEEKRKRDREYKRMKRRTDPEWLERERARRRKYGKNRTRNPEKYREYASRYRSKKENMEKEKARTVVRLAIKKGDIKVPKKCEECSEEPKPLKGGRRALRADHYQGHHKPRIVRFICIDCDGKQLRTNKKLV